MLKLTGADDACRRGGLCRLGGVLLLLVGGCAPPKTPYPAALNSERPAERVLAIRHAVDIQDRSVVGMLVDRLEDEDEAVRFYAILALEKLTGTRRGYEYHAPEKQRGRAVQSWRRHLARLAKSESPSGQKALLHHGTPSRNNTPASQATMSGGSNR